MKNTTVIVIAASSDIGSHLALNYLSNGASVIGTYRNWSPQVAMLEEAGAILFQLDITSSEKVLLFSEELKKSGYTWDVFISAPGQLNPIDKFFLTNFDKWEESVIINSTAQLRVLHALYGLKTTSNLGKVIFFAGGGTNGPFDNYSAYCIGKMALIKISELLDSECPELQVSIIGTGWVNTKIHQQTLAAGMSAGDNLARTRNFLELGLSGSSSLEDVVQCVNWCLQSPRSAVGGRNFSLVHDSWKDPSLIAELQSDASSYKLRRYS